MTTEEYIKRSMMPGWKFQLVVKDSDIYNLQYIHPIKQKLVDRIVRYAKKDSNIERIIVFGSAITNRCHERSDLDICIKWLMASHDEDGVFVRETQQVMRYISLESHGNCDVFAYDYIDSPELKADIDKGVVVYEHNV
ncbi:MAG: nucleotidyltransferase domain-containing protein [Lachnospiraceae bacterium]|nr:nucleotidyltransferase domain-containing protein [Lachnospiraceae bacterium]